MKATELIKRLQELVEEYGDLDVKDEGGVIVRCVATSRYTKLDFESVVEYYTVL